MPRKFNIDDFAHTHINDIRPSTPKPGSWASTLYSGATPFAASIHSDMWVPADRNSVVTLCEAILRLFRDESERKDHAARGEVRRRGV